MATIESMKIGRRVKEQRIGRFETQEEFAATVGISLRQLARIEANEVDPRLSTIKKIADSLGVHPMTLVDREPPEEPEAPEN